MKHNSIESLHIDFRSSIAHENSEATVSKFLHTNHKYGHKTTEILMETAGYAYAMQSLSSKIVNFN